MTVIDGNPTWEDEALEMAYFGTPYEQACDKVILDRLKFGDARPFEYWVLRGHQPATPVLVKLAEKMRAGKLKNSSKIKRMSPPDKAIRDRYIASTVVRTMSGRPRYDAAIDGAKDWLSMPLWPNRVNLGRDAIETAYKKYKDEFWNIKRRSLIP
jgi:hypothetical protein